MPRFISSFSGRHSAITFARGLTALLLVPVVLAGLATRLSAQEVWEYSPYHIQVWLSLGPQAELLALRPELERTLLERADAAVGAPWRLAVSGPPEGLIGEVATRFESVSVDEVKAHAPATLKLDKLYLVNVVAEPEYYLIQTRELDCLARVWGRVVERRVQDLSLIGDMAFSAIVEAFAPLAKVEGVKDKVATLRLRAAGLALQVDSPVLVAENAVFKPYVRTNDKHGEPKPNGITSVPWTMLVMTGRDESLITCEIFSGTRVSITGRPNPRVDRFALFVRVPREVTRLQMQTTDKPPKPMAGYDVFAKDPRTDEQELLGRTDWRGTMDIPPAKFPLRLVYIRNGSQLLARLPMVPGVDPRLVVELNSDDKRLQVEGYLKGMQNNIMDLIIQQKTYTARIHKKMSENKFDEAKKLLDEYISLPTREELNRQVELERTRIKSSHARTQEKIDKLFNDSSKVLTEHIDANLGLSLAKELEEARSKYVPEPVDTPESPAAAPAQP